MAEDDTRNEDEEEALDAAAPAEGGEPTAAKKKKKKKKKKKPAATEEGAADDAANGDDLCGNQESGAPDNTSLSHFSAMTLPCCLRRVVRNRHRHAIEQASRRWRGGRRDDSARARRQI
jgi:hypothetical protein